MSMENQNNNIEYYKSLISDEEVIKALIQDSKEREGELPKEKTRVRPNINFFQRTVSNLVSSNKRIAKHDEGLQKYYDECECDCTPKILSRKISFSSDVSKKTKSDEERSITSPEPTIQKVMSPEERSTSKIKENMKNYIEKKRNKIRRLKLQQERLQKLKALCETKVQKDSSENKNDDCSKNIMQDAKRVRRCSDSSESIVSLSSGDTSHSNDNIITLSDSESEFSDKKDKFIHDLCTQDPSESPSKQKREINM